VAVPRIVTVWCAEWPVVAARVPEHRPAAVVRANRVVACTPAARGAGVVHGLRRRAAQGACPELELIEHDTDRDARAFEPVIRAIAELAPRIEVVEPGWVSLAARGPSRYFGGDQALAERLRDLVGRVVADTIGVTPPAGVAAGVAIGVGVADGRVASSIAARRVATRSGAVVVPTGASPAFLAPLPVGWLRELGDASPELIELFARLGLRTLGALAALDRGDVVARFGAEGLSAHRLAAGDDERPPDAVDPPPEWSAEHPFPDPIERLETVVFVAKRLADELVARLASEGRVCVRLVVTVETEHGERSERVWYRDAGLPAAAMVERVRWQLEGWASQPDGLTGGIVLVRLTPDIVRGDDGIPTRLWGGRSQADLDAIRAIARLAGIAGESAVRVPAWSGGRLPDERYRWVPAAMADLDDPSGRFDRGDGPWPGALPPPSPAVVLADPLPIDVLDQHGDPVAVSGRGEPTGPPHTVVVRGRKQSVVAWTGPWPVEQRWWHPSAGRRLARFQVVTEQGDAHLVVLERRRWSIVATYA
jgi:protein ImuB